MRSRDIIGIFDIENTSVSKITKEYLGGKEKEHRVVNVSTELPKSFIVCSSGDGREKGEITVYISQISCSTLKKKKRLCAAAGNFVEQWLPRDKKGAVDRARSAAFLFCVYR